jgi:hypothetical protein
MDKGTEVIRRADAKGGRPIFGTVLALLPNDRARVHWNVSQNGGVHTATATAGTSNLKISTLVEVTDVVRRQVLELHQHKLAESRRRWIADRPYLCLNINPAARVAQEGHQEPCFLLPGQVSDGLCTYCGAPVVNRCATCERPSTGGQYCSTCQPLVEAALLGARLLDERAAGWQHWPRLKLERLDMEWHGRCLLSQLFGSYRAGIERLDLGPLLIVGPVNFDTYGWEHGFTIPPRTLEEETKAAFARLTAAWKQIIHEGRQASVPVGEDPGRAVGSGK